jgi:CRP-like cAMP-binding protein
MEESTFLKNKDLIIERLRKIDFLKSFKRDYLGEMLQSSKIRQYKPEEIIIPEGTYDEWIYVLLTGKVKVLKKGKELAILEHTGDIFGELAVINQDIRSASVYAVDKTYCLAIDASFLKDLEDRDRTAMYLVIYRVFSEILAERLRVTSEELTKVKEENSYLKRTRTRAVKTPASLTDIQLAPKPRKDS